MAASRGYIEITFRVHMSRDYHKCIGIFSLAAQTQFSLFLKENMALTVFHGWREFLLLLHPFVLICVLVLLLHSN